jgi:hypothetical protein
MKITFLSRFLGFTLAFYTGTILSVFILTVVKTAAFFPHEFLPWLWSQMKSDFFPFVIAELVRSPLMGFLFALVGPRWNSKISTVKFGVWCGAFACAFAFFFGMLGNSGSPFGRMILGTNLIEYFLLGLPVVLVLVSRWFVFGSPVPNR